MNRARRFTPDSFHDARMGVAQRVDGNPPEKIEILFSVGVIYVTTAAALQQKRLALVGRQQEFLGLLYSRIDLRGQCLHSPMLGKVRRRRCFRRAFFGRAAHHAADSAVCALFTGSRMTRVPGMPVASSLTWVSAEREANSNASGAVPPTMRTSRTPPSMARLAASSFKTMPPETTRHCTSRSTSSQLTTDNTCSPLSTPATSVR